MLYAWWSVDGAGGPLTAIRDRIESVRECAPRDIHDLDVTPRPADFARFLSRRILGRHRDDGAAP